MKLSAATVVVVLVLSLTVWVVFHYLQLDLTRSDTAVVVGGMTLLVLGAQWVFAKLKARRNRP
jgi:hypothetical protein